MPGKRSDSIKTRVPVCLCLDVSGSVSGSIDILNAHVKNIYDSIIRLSSGDVAFDIAKFTFGGMFESKQHDVIMDKFTEIEKGSIPGELLADENTPMGKAVKNAFTLLERYKKEIKDSQMQYFQPVFIIISDGQENSTDQDKTWLEVYQKKIREEASNEKMTVVAIGIGRVNTKVMNDFLPEGQEYVSGQNLDFDSLITLLVRTAAKKAPIPRPRIAEVIKDMARTGRKNLR